MCWFIDLKLFPDDPNFEQKQNYKIKNISGYKFIGKFPDYLITNYGFCSCSIIDDSFEYLFDIPDALEVILQNNSIIKLQIICYFNRLPRKFKKEIYSIDEFKELNKEKSLTKNIYYELIL